MKTHTGKNHVIINEPSVDIVLQNHRWVPGYGFVQAQNHRRVLGYGFTQSRNHRRVPGYGFVQSQNHRQVPGYGFIQVRNHRRVLGYGFIQSRNHRRVPGYGFAKTQRYQRHIEPSDMSSNSYLKRLNLQGRRGRPWTLFSCTTSRAQPRCRLWHLYADSRTVYDARGRRKQKSYAEIILRRI